MYKYLINIYCILCMSLCIVFCVCKSVTIFTFSVICLLMHQTLLTSFFVACLYLVNWCHRSEVCKFFCYVEGAT
ncbi:hypothetical protein X975_16843, partial [Stegodyphus mimosarum]